MAKAKSAYGQKLLDPKWQQKRLRLMERAQWACEACGDKENTLHVHHGYYRYGMDPWEYPDSSLHVYCESCHECANHQRVELQEVSASLDYYARDSLTELAKGIAMITDGTQWSLLDAMCDMVHERIKRAALGDGQPRVTVVWELRD